MKKSERFVSVILYTRLFIPARNVNQILIDCSTGERSSVGNSEWSGSRSDQKLRQLPPGSVLDTRQLAGSRQSREGVSFRLLFAWNDVTYPSG